MLRIKSGEHGASLRGLRPEMIPVLIVANDAFAECVITSGTDGRHSWGSLHYKGLALDFRIRHLPQGHPRIIANKIRDALGDEYDVVLEDTHIHVEFDPKEPK